MELLSPARSSSRESLSYSAVIRWSACLIAIGAPFRLTARLWYNHYTTSAENVQHIMPDQSHQFFLNGLGALGRTVDIRPVKGIADLSAETKGFLLHTILSFRKYGNDIVSLVASIIILFPFIFSMLWCRVGVALQPLDQVILHDQLAPADVQRGKIFATEQVVGSCPRDPQGGGDLCGINDVR